MVVVVKNFIEEGLKWRNHIKNYQLFLDNMQYGLKGLSDELVYDYEQRYKEHLLR